MNSRRLRYLFGIFAAVIGIGLLFSPEAAAGLTTSDTIVLVLGVVALVQAILVISRRNSPVRVSFPTPEYRSGTRTPGGPFDSRLEQLDSRVRKQVQSSVTEALARFTTGGGHSTSEVREQLQQGTWTTDPMAAAFFSSRVDISGLYRPPWLGGEPLIQKQARAAIRALFEIVSEHTPRFDPVELENLVRNQNSGGSSSEIEPGNATEPGEYTTYHWDGIGAVALITIAIAILAQQPPLLLVGAIGVALTGYSAYGRVGSFTDVDLAIERRVSTDSPARGDDVTVHVRVRNQCDRVLPDVRLVDGVPSELVVTDGSPRRAATLAAEQEITFTYTVEAEFGEHTFEPMFVLVQDVTGERQQVLYVDGDEVSLTCYPPPAAMDEVTVRGLTTGYPGELTTNEGGQGVQFHDKRQYQPGDPISLIDWNSLARTGELTTLRFEEEQMAKVMIMVDARQESNLAPSPTERSAIARSVEAADILVASLLNENHIAGVTAISPTPCWLQPGRGTEHSAKARQLLAAHSAFDPPSSADESFLLSQTNWYLQKLATTSQAIVLTPLCDDFLPAFIKRLEATGTPITVISPDPTTQETPGELLSRIDRQLRIVDLREAQIPVYEWRRDESLALALERGHEVNA